MVDDHAKAASQLSTLSEVAFEITSERASERIPQTIEWVLEAAREELGMEVAFVSEFSQQRMVFRKLAGEAESFGWKEDDSVALDDTFCRRLLEGHLPNVIPDAKADGRVSEEYYKEEHELDYEQMMSSPGEQEPVDESATDVQVSSSASPI